MLICKNVIVNGRRTSMRLDRETWISLADICSRRHITIHELCSKIDCIRGKSGLSSATRLFVLTYFRSELNKYEKPTFTVPPEYNPNTVLAQAV
jgi:predicted DNA-binding ribbon-helix-helix protein